ncbi:MAG: DinB family protein [Fimbriimonadaceae bacterium]|nr:DinB family protein [Fimbriimonadaceae bacterium]
MDDEQLKTDLRTAWEFAHRHEHWVSPLEQELKGLSAQDASWRPSPGATSIWEIVLHMAVWNENIVDRVQTGENVHPPEGAWPALPADLDEEAWSAAKSRLRASIGAVDAMIATTTVTQIEASPYGLPDLLVRYIHMGYHIGQIVKMREELRLR